MPKQSNPRLQKVSPRKASLQLSQADVEQSLKELARLIGDEHGFLVLAKKAWRATHFDKIPKRGRHSVAEKCFNAIIDGFDELGIDSNYYPRAYDSPMGGGRHSIQSREVPFGPIRADDSR